MTDICHITKVVINTVGDPRIIDQVERSNFCGGVSTNSMTQLSLATDQRDTTMIIQVLFLVLSTISLLISSFSVHGPCGGFETMCLTENGIPVDLKGVCC